MIIDWKTVRIFVKPGATDMRKQINGLSLIVSEKLKMNVFEGNLFLFCNKHRRILKIIYWVIGAIGCSVALREVPTQARPSLA